MMVLVFELGMIAQEVKGEPNFSGWTHDFSHLQPRVWYRDQGCPGALGYSTITCLSWEEIHFITSLSEKL
jgi:hypothetical protein